MPCLKYEQVASNYDIGDVGAANQQRGRVDFTKFSAAKCLSHPANKKLYEYCWKCAAPFVSEVPQSRTDLLVR